MADILIYVNENTSCSVVVENVENMTLDRFRWEILDEQVDDVLNFPFKFTRLVNNKSVVVGRKQEAFVKLDKCLRELSDA